MPLVRMTTSVATADFDAVVGDEVVVSGARAQQIVDAGWGELVRDEQPRTPEDGATRAETPEGSRQRRVQRRGGG